MKGVERKILLHVGLPLLSVIMCALFPILFVYFANAGDAQIQEVFPAALIYFTIGVALWGAASLMIKKTYLSVVISNLFCIAILNYAIIEKGGCLVFPGLSFWSFAPITLIGLLHVAYFLKKRMSEDGCKIVLEILCAVFGGLILINGIVAVPRILETLAIQHSTDVVFRDEQKSATDDLPNIYYLIFDEMASFQQMEKYYNYDNVDLKQYFLKNHFTNSMNSYNEGIQTAMVTANITSLDYVAKPNDSEAYKDMLRKSGNLFKILAQYGYQIDAPFRGEYYGVVTDQNAETMRIRTVAGEDFTTTMLRQTIFYPYFYLVEQNTSAQIQNLMEKLNYMKSEEIFTENPTFLLFHIGLPHQPFLVDAQGNRLPDTVFQDWSNDDIYKGQYIFASRQIIELVDNIKKNDPDSIIIVQSDHGARASSDPELWKKKFEIDDVRCILNAVYYRGESIEEIKGQSAVNTIRIVLNKLFNMSMPLVEVPRYDYSQH